jgi:CheY-like chemotaxis protein
MSVPTPTAQPILLVEDSDEDYTAFRRALRDVAVPVALYRCTRVEEALDYLRGQGCFTTPEQAPRPALILLDLNLPGTDGRELLATLKGDTQLRSIPVVIVTTARNPRDVEWCYAHGANGYQVKSMDYVIFRDELRRSVEHWLAASIRPAGAGGDAMPG